MPTTYLHASTALGQAVFDEADALMVVDDFAVFADDSLERWEVFIDGIGRRAFLSSATWESFDGVCELAFEDDFITPYMDREVREMRFITTDAGPYAAAARRQAEQAGTATVKAKDALTDLTERADGLIVQAASLNKAPTETQLQIFAVRHAKLVEDMAALEEQMARLRGKIDFAGVALVDAATS